MAEFIVFFVKWESLSRFGDDVGPQLGDRQGNTHALRRVH